MLIRWGWLCPWLAILLAAGVLVAFGLTWWSALLAALFLVCPALLLWGLYVTRPQSDEADAPTDGMLMDWTAPFYDIYCSAIGLGEGFRAQALRVAAIQPGEKVLDVGCGTGVLTPRAAEAAGRAQRVRDTASGMRVVRRSSLPRLMPLPDGLHFTPAMSARAMLSGDLKILEVNNCRTTSARGSRN